MPNGPARTLKLRLNEVELAGLDSAGEPRRVLRQGERRHDRRGDAGGDLREPDPAAGLRPVRRVGALLQPRRRGEPRPLAVGARCARTGPGVLRTGSSRARSPPARRAARAGGRLAARLPARRRPSQLPGRLAPSLRSEQVLELRGRLRGGHALHRRPLPRPASQGGVAPTLRALISRSLRTVRMRGRGAQVAREARRRLGQGDPVPARSGCKPGYYVVRRNGRGRDERCAEGDVRRPTVRGRRPETLT